MQIARRIAKGATDGTDTWPVIIEVAGEAGGKPRSAGLQGLQIAVSGLLRPFSGGKAGGVGIWQQ